MNTDPERRRALVTGGASGIGYAVSEALLSAGAKVAMGDNDPQGMDRAVRSLNNENLLPIELDVTCNESVRRAVHVCVETFGGLDTLVNSAGIIHFKPLEEISPAEWNRLIAVDLTGVFLCCQAAAPFLRQTRRGRIVTISSDAGKIGVAMLSEYCAAKFGVIGFSKAIAGELAPYGVTVNCVCPGGVTSTQMGQQVLHWLSDKTGRSRENILTEREKSVPLGRMQTTADVVGAVMFLISEGASHITGEALNVNGGSLATSSIPGL